MLPREKMERSQRFVWHCLPGWVTRTGLLPSLHPWWHSKFSPAPKNQSKFNLFCRHFLTKLSSMSFPPTFVLLQHCWRKWLWTFGATTSGFCRQPKPSLREVGLILGKVVCSNRRILFPCIIPATLREILESPNNVHFLKVFLMRLPGRRTRRCRTVWTADGGSSLSPSMKSGYPDTNV